MQDGLPRTIYMMLCVKMFVMMCMGAVSDHGFEDHVDDNDKDNEYDQIKVRIKKCFRALALSK